MTDLEKVREALGLPDAEWIEWMVYDTSIDINANDGVVMTIRCTPTTRTGKSLPGIKEIKVYTR